MLKTICQIYTFIFCCLWQQMVFADTAKRGQSLNQQALIKVGEGAAYWGIFKLYDAGFYVAKNTKKQHYLDDAVPAKLKLCYVRKITVQNFIDGANHALPKKRPASLDKAIKKLHASYQPVKKGDCYVLQHHPDMGTQLLLNGKLLSTIKTKGFKAMYFGIWLGDYALSKKLKKQLLNE